MDLARTLIRHGLLAVAALLACGCKAYPPGVPLPDIVDEINATLQPNVIMLQPGDTLELKFPNNANLNQTVKVRPDGNCSFLLVGEMNVAGLSLSELQDVLGELYDESVVAADLLVRTGPLRDRNVYFLGPNGGRGNIQVSPGLTIDLLEALSRSREPKNSFTLMEHALLLRWMPDEGVRRAWVIDVSPEYWTHPQPLYLQDGDYLYLPRHPIKTVNEWIRELLRLLPVPNIVTGTF
jgi:protein involved in polysaccharide export with SLBB domain